MTAATSTATTPTRRSSIARPSGLQTIEAELIDKARRFGAPRAGAARGPARSRRHLPDREFPRHARGGPARASACRGRRAAPAPSFRTYCLAAAELGRYCGATALSWNMHVCSTLVDRRARRRSRHDGRGARRARRAPQHALPRASSTTARSTRSRSPKAARRPPAWSPSAPRPSRSTAASWSTARKSSPRCRARPTTTACCAPSAAKARRRRRRNTLYLAVPANAPGVSVVGDWDPLGMRGTVSRTLADEGRVRARGRDADAARRLFPRRDLAGRTCS